MTAEVDTAIDIATEWDDLAAELSHTIGSLEIAAKNLRRRVAHAQEQARLLRGDPPPTVLTGTKVNRILWNRGRDTIDEIVVHDCTVHVEQMTDNCWWIGIYKGEEAWSGNFHCPHHRSKEGMSFTEQDDDLTWDREDEHR